MIKKKVEKALNTQINEEMYSAYLYLAMSAKFEEQNLSGFARWMQFQAQEEMGHAMKIYGFIHERGGTVDLKEVKAPAKKFESPLEAFEAAYKHEQHITGCIDKLVNLAIEEGDHATQIFLQWFVNEQVEEEASADEVVQKLKLAGDHRGALFMLDRELGARGSGGE
jgi:ferritin